MVSELRIQELHYICIYIYMYFNIRYNIRSGIMTTIKELTYLQ